MVLFDNIEDLFQSVREFSDYTKALITLATAIGALVMIIVTLKFLYSLLNGKLHKLEMTLRMFQ